MLPQPDAAAAGRAGKTGVDQLDPGVVERGHELHQRIDVAADDAVARFHALDRRHRKVGELSHFALIDAQERTRGPELIGRNHERGFSNSSPVYLYYMNYGLKHQFRGLVYQRPLPPGGPRKI